MPFDPDTEIQYRKGGKIMKKTPRKFNTGGMAPTPTTKPAPKRVTTPSDQPDAKTAAEMRRQVAEEKMGEGQRKAAEDFYGDKQRLGNKMKKGGKVKKFGEGDMVTQDTRERRADEKPRSEPAPIVNRTSPLPSGNEARDAEFATNPNTKYGRFDDDTYRRAYAQADKTPAPKKEAPKKEAPKASKPAPKAASKKEAPKKESLSDYGESNEPDSMRETRSDPVNTYSNMRRSGDFELSSLKPRSAEPDFNPFDKDFAALKNRRGSRAEDIYPSLMGKKAGGVVKKYAKGGGIESKGKTAGKIVKMAKGGSVRGYGISKVTNKTKYV